MSVKKNNHSDTTANLQAEIKTLRKKLRIATQSGQALQADNIDAFFIATKKTVKVYTEETADKIYRILIEKMHEGAVTLTEQGTILYCNVAFSHMVNLPLHRLAGTQFRTLINFSKKKWDALVKYNKKEIVSRELQVFSAGRAATPVLMSMNELSIDKQNMLSIILTDLTIQNKNQEELKSKSIQLEQKNEELQNANKDLTSFTYVSSHDLQEPLRKIQTFVGCILREDEKNLSATGKEYFRRMSLSAERMQTLIKDLLIYSETKNSELKFERTGLKGIVDDVKNDFDDIMREKNATIGAASLGEGTIIPFQFRQLIHNLVSNSLKFSKPLTAPRIKLKSEIIYGRTLKRSKLKPETEYCHITYTDNGIGFDPKYSDRIFEVFQRLHTQEEYIGTGIGLAICKRIVENHHGMISASSELNRGARFDIYIPE